MGSGTLHAVIIPYPAQGDITPCLHLSKLLHLRIFHVTFVNTDYNRSSMLRPREPLSLSGIDRFRFESTPNGLPASEDDDRMQDIPELCVSTSKSYGGPLRELITRIGSSAGVPPVSCVIADSLMAFALDVVDEVGELGLVFCTMSACGFMGYLHFFDLIDRGYVPLKAT